jgi:hypothetical protein
MNKSRRMRRLGHVEGRGRGEVYTWFWWGNLRETDHLENTVLSGGIIKMDLLEVEWEHFVH